jgi:hypothetical protein
MIKKPYLHEVNADGVIVYVYGNDDLDQICGQTFDFNTQTWVGYIGELPIKRDNN